MQAAPAISFAGVTKRYRNGVLGLNDVRFAIRAGARAGLLGPNGAGKSTAVRLLQGALAPTAGSVTLLGAAAGSNAYSEVRRRVGVVPQVAGAYRDLSAREYLQLARSLYGRGDVAATAGGLELTPHLDKLLSELSGGLLRRVLLAAALLSEPEVLLLDEPTLGLDPVASNDMRGLLARVGSGRTLLLCTNNLAEAQEVCDEVVILDRGRVVLQQRLEDMRRGALRVALRAREGPEALAAFARSRGLDASMDGAEVIVQVPDGETAVPPLLRAALDVGLQITECRQLERDLETVFFEVVGRQ